MNKDMNQRNIIVNRFPISDAVSTFRNLWNPGEKNVGGSAQ